MRYPFILASMLIGLATPASAQLSIGIGLPGLSIGINVPMFPNLVRVPGYPVYYAPGLESNFFFYDGMYWVYQDDQWYASSWYNGPWGLVSPDVVPLYVLRIPVRYYRRPPPYFRGWQIDAPPRWGEHWGPSWQRQRSGWDRWNRNASPAPAPLPVYQRQYPADRYPAVEQQPALRGQNYRYQPHDLVVRQHFQEQAPAQRTQPAAAPPHAQDPVRSKPVAREPPVSEQPRQAQPAAAPREPPQPAARQREPRADNPAPREAQRGQGQGQSRDRENDDERGQERKR